MNEKKTVGQATASMVLGILSFLLLGLFTAIPAVICGHIAKSKIKSDPENLKGDGQALAGLIMGYIVIALIPLAILAAVAIPLMSGNQVRAVATEGQAGCATIATAERMHKVMNGAYIELDNPEILEGIEKGDLQGTYFDHDDYSVEVVGGSTLIITATANGTGDIIGDVVMTVSDAGTTTWSGSLLE
ncbi:DUF4190 domain-containing protein [Pontiellaceae bacterium B12227]|nr:DUF4190 domain-containing protein [Pontiellaceae bacterium B12227]